MNDFTSFYNSLPSIVVANRLFINRAEILSKLAPLLSANENKFGVCLVHRHCQLEDGERMVATGDVSQPEENGEFYPERWLATGEPYEFNREPTISPPQNLFEEFQKIVGDVKVLGLFFIRDEGKKGGITLERTEGRRNIVEIVPHGTPRRAITTAWLPKQENADPARCILVECTQCTDGSNGHGTNVNKMGGLMQRRDLGHNIRGLRGDGDAGLTY